MLPEALMVVASAAGTAVVQAAGTDAWVGLRARVSRVFSRGDAAAALVVLERLDRTAAALDAGGLEEITQVRSRLEASWQARFEDLLETLDETDRLVVAEQLRELVVLPPEGAGGAWAGDAGLAISGNVEIRAEGGSVASGVVHGDISMGDPSQPGPGRD
ncbi:hypothetical protein OG453_44270 [Streptomyces sp. NBC_01381]|uniref:hypothetical protein n=1 Tax=Streptomyces sp. NBC_01381 TaxID=2903845 RepID=UPI002257EE60|nr:hypothetical protein [Streptomyces sp. NBC_01381]MCX4673575.1 hypothetical protein [Streptomyces sp. NBC_01381]